LLLVVNFNISISIGLVAGQTVIKYQPCGKPQTLAVIFGATSNKNKVSL